MHTMSSKYLNIKGLNTQGLKSNIDHIINLLQETDILFLSEHWLSNAENIIIQNMITNKTHNIFFTPAEKQPAGRPYGGNCFLVRNSGTEKVKVIHEDKHILAVQFVSSSLNLIVIGVYLTCYHDLSSKDEYTQELNTITAIIEMYTDESEIIIIGDFQTFPSNMYNHLPRNSEKRNPLSPILQRFLLDNELELIYVVKGKGPIHTYEHKTLHNQSYIDHVAILKDSSLVIKDCRIHEKCSTNIGDHQEVEINIELEPTLPDIIKQDIPRCVPNFHYHLQNRTQPPTGSYTIQ